MEAHPGAMEANPGVTGSHTEVVEACHGDMDANPGVVKTRTGADEAPP